MRPRTSQYLGVELWHVLSRVLTAKVDFDRTIGELVLKDGVPSLGPEDSHKQRLASLINIGHSAVRVCEQNVSPRLNELAEVTENPKNGQTPSSGRCYPWSSCNRCLRNQACHSHSFEG